MPKAILTIPLFLNPFLPISSLLTGPCVNIHTDADRHKHTVTLVARVVSGEHLCQFLPAPLPIISLRLATRS